jgi:hypothetical protein
LDKFIILDKFLLKTIETILLSYMIQQKYESNKFK